MSTICLGDQCFAVQGHGQLYLGEPFWEAVQNHRWEKETFDIIRRFCSREHAFIDIGAWIGPTTLFGACVAGHVYCVEPDPVALCQLKENIALNTVLESKITLFEGCLSDVSGTVVMGNSADLGNSETSLFVKNASQQISVEALTFPDFVTRYNIQNCSMIKMDVEGAEFLILPLMIDFLAGCKPTLLLSLHRPHYGDRASEVLELIFEILACIYKNIYLTSGQRLAKISDVRESFFDLVATNAV